MLRDSSHPSTVPMQGDMRSSDYHKFNIRELVYGVGRPMHLGKVRTLGFRIRMSPTRMIRFRRRSHLVFVRLKEKAWMSRRMMHFAPMLQSRAVSIRTIPLDRISPDSIQSHHNDTYCSAVGVCKAC